MALSGIFQASWLFLLFSSSLVGIDKDDKDASCGHPCPLSSVYGCLFLYHYCSPILVSVVVNEFLCIYVWLNMHLFLCIS